jgi:hypothetical protein
LLGTPHACSALWLTLPEQLGQPRDGERDAPRLVRDDHEADVR